MADLTGGYDQNLSEVPKMYDRAFPDSFYSFTEPCYSRFMEPDYSRIHADAIKRAHQTRAMGGNLEDTWTLPARKYHVRCWSESTIRGLIPCRIFAQLSMYR
jgi:hypothetical protein